MRNTRQPSYHGCYVVSLDYEHELFTQNVVCIDSVKFTRTLGQILNVELTRTSEPITVKVCIQFHLRLRNGYNTNTSNDISMTVQFFIRSCGKFRCEQLTKEGRLVVGFGWPLILFDSTE